MVSGHVRSLALYLSAVVFCLVATNQAAAQNWVKKMFSETEHNFGTVARGSDTVFKFPVKNIYKQDIELVSVRSSCGCTSPSLEHKLIKTGETGYVVAKFNTRTFDGVHSATLTVDVQWNDNGITRRGETQLRVHGDIRSDVVFEPGAVKFNNVDQGAKSEQQVRVRYAGRSDWKITDVRGASDDLEVELTETGRQGGRVTYDLLVRLKEGTPAGYFNEQLVLVTSDSSNPRIPLHVEGRVVPEISASPESLQFGNVTSAASLPKKFVVRGKKPFKITSIESASGQFEFKTDEGSSARHFVEVVFTGSEQPGPVKETIHITTDLGDKFAATVTAYATVLPAVTETPAVEAPAAATNDVTSTSAASGGKVAAQ